MSLLIHGLDHTTMRSTCMLWDQRERPWDSADTDLYQAIRELGLRGG